jgi:uncharacterized membrane protein
MYSAQEKTWIKGTKFAYSSLGNDNRTWVSYFKDENNKIHSSQTNYSIIYSRPLSEEEFRKTAKMDNSEFTYN